MSQQVKKYFDDLKTLFKTGHAREHSYRGLLEILVESINPSIDAVNEPKQQKVGAPDYVILKGKIPVGYIEAKDVTVDLDHELKTRNQVNRYKASLNNLVFTNYLEFIFYQNGEQIERIKVAELKGNNIETIDKNFEKLESLLKNFTIKKSISIKNAKELAKLMANKAKMLKNTIFLALEDETVQDGQVEKQYEVFKQMLIHDLSKEQFADIYAQTVAYGMFAARYHDDSLDTFNRDEANRLLPKSNPFLRNFFQSIAGYNIDERIVWMVDDMADMFNYVDVHDLLVNFGVETKREDVIVHFYETFLGEYDAKLRKSRGVYYTPAPVVDFMVRAVDDILKSEFGIKDGISDTSKIDVLKEVQGQKKRVSIQEHRVQILDPATGTGTFLDHIIKYIYNSKFKGQEGLWQSYVDEHLIPRLHGFEILMASYAMAHLKLDITLSETGYDFKKGSGRRLGVYLTNSLEEPEKSQRDLFSQWLSQESEAANEVKKEKPIMVVIGNPPYSGHSSNVGEYAKSLVNKYKFEPGGKIKLKERNPKWLNDDYVKFISYAEELINKNGNGIIAFINNHSWLDNPTFRGMRWHLMQTFDEIYILDLHGNAKKKETTPDGGKDENVFDIQQGVSINIFVKRSNSEKKPAKVFHYDLYGKRQVKYDYLNRTKLNKIKFANLELQKPFFVLTNTNSDTHEEYFTNLGLNELIIHSSVGVQTHADVLALAYTNEELLKKLEDNEIQMEKKYLSIATYRPFDKRIYYEDPNIVQRPRTKINKNFNQVNLNLCFIKQFAYNVPYSYTFITQTRIIDRVFISNKGAAYSGPLYIYSENSFEPNSRQPNLDSKLISEIATKLDLKFIPDHEYPDAGKPGTFHPVDVLDYIYAILHSPTYRERYKEFLKIDFPRVPFTSNQDLFWKLVKLGGELRKFHLMEHEDSEKLITTYPMSGENEVVKVEYHLTPALSSEERVRTGKVYINENQYFDSVPEVAWNFYIGGYQPAQKWLKDRKGRKLNFEDILHYQKIIVALVNTDRLMKEVDKEIKEWPIK